jgi:hypothetical protein
LITPACKRKDNVRVEKTEEQGASLASVVHVADPNSASQLLSGFHEIEQNSWRWTMGRFAVSLRPPSNAAQKGATLQLKLSVAEPIIQKFKAIALSAKIGATALPPESYTQSGEFVYSRDVPPDLLTGNSVTVEFALDKYAQPGEFDGRELGVIVSSVGLEPK